MLHLFLHDTKPGGYHYWVEDLVKKVKVEKFANGWVTLRDIIRIFFEFHTIKTKGCLEAWEMDPRHQGKTEQNELPPGRNRKRKAGLGKLGGGAGQTEGAPDNFEDGEIAEGVGGGAGSFSKPEKVVLGCWWCGDNGCTYREPASGELVCQWSKEYGDHPNFQDVKLLGLPLWA